MPRSSGTTSRYILAAVSIGSITYQHRMVLCGKSTCRRRHGPYWYAYWRDGKRTRSRYVGSELPREVAHALSPRRQVDLQARRRRRRR